MRARLIHGMMPLGALTLASLLAVACATAQPRRGPAPVTALRSGTTDLSCGGAQAGLSLWGADRIKQILALTEDQSAKFNTLKEASDKARQYLQDNCPADNPVTPTARAAATEHRLEAMLEAVRTIKPALDDFYNGLTDEQKARLNAVAPANRPVDSAVQPANAKPIRHHHVHYWRPFRWFFRF
jgi:Spy/CpxP family protein refolding chaperone